MEDFPRLAGQLYDYVINKLTNWPKERGQNSQKPDNSEIMAPFAQKLTKEQIAAVAAYVSDLKIIFVQVGILSTIRPNSRSHAPPPSRECLTAIQLGTSLADQSRPFVTGLAKIWHGR